MDYKKCIHELITTYVVSYIYYDCIKVINGDKFHKRNRIPAHFTEHSAYVRHTLHMIVWNIVKHSYNHAIVDKMVIYIMSNEGIIPGDDYYINLFRRARSKAIFQLLQMLRKPDSPTGYAAEAA